MAILLVKNIGCLQTPVGSFSHKGPAQGENIKLKDASILIEDGIITGIASDGQLPEGHKKADQVFDAEGKLVTPGLVDGHTHMIFGGYRQHEVPMKIKGVGYLDILKAGGGINYTVKKTREATAKELYDKTVGFLDEMMSLGVTTCEAKSGYGLDLENEVKLLEVLKDVNENHPMDVVSTFMGAHALPPEYKEDREGFLRLMIDEVLPFVKEKNLAEFADVFTEEGVFDYKESREYLEAARDLGFKLKVHADEIFPIGGSVLAGELNAVSAEHLIAIDEKGLEAMAKAGVTAMCLPGTSFYLGANFAPARKMIEMGIPVAAASDFNPGSCPSLNLQFIINLAMLKYRMMPEEVLTAVTINPACAIGMGEKVGTVEVGKQGDLTIWNTEDFEMVCYRYGSNLVKNVIKKGEVIL